MIPEVLLFLPPLLYAETHYRFRYFFSYLKKREPEILADAPHRLEPDQPLPLLILAKDAHLFPATLRSINVTLSNGTTTHKSDIVDSPISLTDQLDRSLAGKYWWKVFHLDVSLFSGWIDVDVSFTIEVRGKTKTYRNDNYRTSSHKPLRVFVSPESLPRLPGLHFGDPHTHSHYTEDQVEYGAPPEAARQLCKGMGLSFFCVTDHSYDLDDRTDNYLVNDPQIPKWHSLQKEIDSLNAKEGTFSVIRGEEISCRNNEGRNVHLLLIGTRKFFPGSGDSAERWLRTRSEYSISEILAARGSDTSAFAAHPNETVPFLQRLLLRRGEWTRKDWGERNITGFQFVNGSWDDGFESGLKGWINELLQGRRSVAIAGNDAHGNFNRFRQIGIPFFKIKEHDRHLFGKVRTGAFLEGQLNEREVVTALSRGACIMTDGPVVALRATNKEGQTAGFGATLEGTEFDLLFKGRSSSEFGAIHSVIIHRGIIGESSEHIIATYTGTNEYDIERNLAIQTDRSCYVRIELRTKPDGSYDGRRHLCLTNPIWLIPPKENALR